MHLSQSTAPKPVLTSWHWLLAAAAFVVILAGLRAVSHIVTPILLAAFLAIICAAPLSWAKQRHIPGSLAILVLFSAVGFGFFLLFLALKNTAESLAVQAPVYQAQLGAWLEDVRALLTSHGLPGDRLPTEIPLPGAETLTGAARSIASGLGQFTATSLLVLLAFIFLLLEEHTLPGKLEEAFPGRVRARVRARRFMRSVYRYLVIKSLTSIATGVLVGAGLAVMGVDFALLWGILAGLLNFIPTIGSIIAAVPAILVSLLGQGVTEALIVLVLFVVVNVGIGSLLEPRYMGRSLGLSPLVVLISLLVWGWVFGPVGMLLAVPLTMIAKLALESAPQTRWAAVMISDKAKGG